MVWDNCLYSVNYILNKHWPVARQKYRWGNQTRSRGRSSRQENSEKKEAHFSGVLTHPQKKQDVTASLKKVLSHVANIDKNNGLT